MNNKDKKERHPEKFGTENISEVAVFILLFKQGLCNRCERVSKFFVPDPLTMDDQQQSKRHKSDQQDNRTPVDQGHFPGGPGHFAEGQPFTDTGLELRNVFTGFGQGVVVQVIADVFFLPGAVAGKSMNGHCGLRCKLFHPAVPGKAAGGKRHNECDRKFFDIQRETRNVSGTKRVPEQADQEEIEINPDAELMVQD